MKAGKDNTVIGDLPETRQITRRLRALLLLAIAIFMALAVRLWWLQVMNHESFAERARQNRTRSLLIPAPRGKIFGRNGGVLAESRPSYNIIVSRRDMRSVTEEIEILVNHLGIDHAWLVRRFEEARYEPKYESLVVKEMASAADITWVMAHQYEYPELRVESVPQRHYPNGGFAAHVLGYVGEVSPRELQAGRFGRENGYKMGDIIGKSGVERLYNEVLMGKDGKRIVVVDSRGRIQFEVDRVEPTPGRNLYTTLDFDLQQAAEQQGDLMPKGRGAIAVMDPNNGQMLALVSRPAFDSDWTGLLARDHCRAASLRVLGALVADFGQAHLIEMERLRFCGDHRARLNAGHRAAVKAGRPCRGWARFCATYCPAIRHHLALGALINGATTDQSGADVIAGARTVFTPRHEIAARDRIRNSRGGARSRPGHTRRRESGGAGDGWQL
jgi:hypothetical protein